MAESLATITTDVITGGTNNHSTIAAAMNAYATDFVDQGVVGTIVLNTGSGGTGAFAVNADTSPDMGVTVLAGVAYIAATPSSQNAQVLRAYATANTTSYTINANTSGSTKYDWIYLSVSATNANVPDAGADNVTALYTSRSTSNVTDTGSPPTYGINIAVITVANGASSITNSNISDTRENCLLNSSGGGAINVKALFNPYKFFAYRNASLSQAQNTTIVFDTEVYDTGSNYSVSTGKFTAPVAGFYKFDACVQYTSGNYIFALGLQKNGSGQLIAGPFTDINVTTNFALNGSFAPLQLAANDTIAVYWGSSVNNTTIAVGTAPINTWFSGFLVSAT